MATIGALSYFSVKRETARAGEKVRRITRAHVDGTALRREGRQGIVFRLVAIAHSLNDTTKVTAIEAAANLSGDVLTVVDDFGTTWTNIAILEAPTHKTEPMERSTDGSTRRIEFVYLAVDTNPS